jgi:hypothetical protein
MVPPPHSLYYIHTGFPSSLEQAKLFVSLFHLQICCFAWTFTPLAVSAQFFISHPWSLSLNVSSSGGKSLTLGSALGYPAYCQLYFLLFLHHTFITIYNHIIILWFDKVHHDRICGCMFHSPLYELRALCFLSRCSTTWALFAMVILR